MNSKETSSIIRRSLEIRIETEFSCSRRRIRPLNRPNACWMFSFLEYQRGGGELKCLYEDEIYKKKLGESMILFQKILANVIVFSFYRLDLVLIVLSSLSVLAAVAVT